jgi:hypothetical protein
VNVKVPNQNITLKQGTRSDGKPYVMTDFFARPSWAPDTTIHAQIGGDKRSVLEGAMAMGGDVEIESKQFNQQFGTFRLYLPQRQSAPAANAGGAATGGGGGTSSPPPDRRQFQGRKIKPDEFFNTVKQAGETMRIALGCNGSSDPTVQAALIDGTSKLLASYIIAIQTGVIDFGPGEVATEALKDKQLIMDEINAPQADQDRLVALRNEVLEHNGMVAAEKLAALTQIKRRLEALAGGI